MAGRPGAIEHHPERNAIHDAILARETFRAISRRFGMGKDSVSRYVNERLPPEVKAAYEREGAAACADLIADLREFYAMLKKLARDASETHDREAKHLLLKALAQALPYTRAIGEMRGDIQEASPTVNVQNVVNVQVNYGGMPAPIAIEGQVVGENGNGNGLAVSEG